MWKSFMAAVLLTSSAAAHELTPTYPEFKPHIVDGVYYAKLHMWNRREDVKYYEISVHDEEWNKIPFHSNKKIMKLEHLEHADFEVNIRKSDLERVEFICTTSKHLKSDVTGTGVRSRICSRIK